MEIKNYVIQCPLYLYNTNVLYSQLKSIDQLTHKEEVTSLVDINGKYLTINRCVHPNIFIINYSTKFNGEKEIIITENDLYEP